ncbi:MAG: hypothetical protein QG630_112 [Patescibacteria group bacterium]|nr:hypothetical protein [Patescibacteria group bacterium]
MDSERQISNIENKKSEPKIKEGADFVFKQNLELAKIGSKEQYSEYLDFIFPESKIRINNESVIMYHNSENKFDISLYDKDRNMYWTSSREGHFESNENTICAILNVNNPKYVDAYEITNKISKESTKEYKDKDGLIAENEVYIERIKESNKNLEDYKQDLLFPEVLIFNPDQIHILGSKQDLENFKKFIEDKNKNQDEKYLVK